MKLPHLPLLVLITSASHVLADRSHALPDPSTVSSSLQPRGGQDGRACDFTEGYYVDWGDCSRAAAQWCSAHAGQEVAQGSKIDDGNVQGYKSGHWNVELYVKYQNDHVETWPIYEEACNWYLQYIAQGCTPGGDRPTDPGRQLADGGTFYEPLMGSVDMQWVPTT